MTKTYNLKNLQPGDRLVLPKSNLGFVQHHAIYIGMMLMEIDNTSKIILEKEFKW